MFVDFLQFLCQYILAGFVLSFARVKLIGTDAEKALAFIQG